jgi:Holliday junction resolvase RusA-like endonuclease
MIELFVEVISSKNSRPTDTRTGRTFKSKGARLNEKVFAVQLAEQKETWEMMTRGKAFPYVIIFRLRRKTRRKFDYNNLFQGVLDAMVKAGYLPDDDMSHVIPVPAEWVHAKDNPGCDITLGDWINYQMLTGDAA